MRQAAFLRLWLLLAVLLSSCSSVVETQPLPAETAIPPATVVRVETAARIQEPTASPSAVPPTAVPRTAVPRTAVPRTPTPGRAPAVQTETPEASEDIPQPGPAPSQPAEVGEPAQVAAEWLDVWDDPANEKSYWHRVTQLLMGERVLVLAEDGEWAQIAAVEQPSSLDPAGYPGWVRRDGLAPGWRAPGQAAVVMRRYAFLRQEPDLNAAVLQRLHLDMRLPALQVGEAWVELELPDGRRGWAPVSDVRLAEDPDQPVPLDGMWAILADLEGISYLWGGTTGHSLDCSGFTYRVLHAHGYPLARDAHDQADQAAPVEAGDWRPGDFLFYSVDGRDPVTHVGIYAGDGVLVDANPYIGLTRHRMSEMEQWYAWYGMRRLEWLAEGGQK